MNTRDLLEIVINEYKNVKFDKLNIDELFVVMDKLNNVYENRLFRYARLEDNKNVYSLYIEYLYIHFYKKYEPQALRYNFLKKETLKLIDRLRNALGKKNVYDVYVGEYSIFENKPTYTIEKYNFNQDGEIIGTVKEMFENNEENVNKYLRIELEKIIKK